MPQDTEIVTALEQISTATISSILLKKGVRRVWMRGPSPLREGSQRIAGPAFTMRFVPAREDVSLPDAVGSPRSTRRAIEAMPAGVVVVADARGIPDAGIFGDILCARMRQLGVRGLVTDGVMRDRTGVLRSRLPVWCDGAAAPPALSALHFVGWEEPVGCGGVAVFPGDMIVADDDGAVVIPPQHLEAVVAAGPEQERLEDWIMGEVEGGAALPGLYPIDDANRERYQRARSARSESRD